MFSSKAGSAGRPILSIPSTPRPGACPRLATLVCESDSASLATDCSPTDVLSAGGLLNSNSATSSPVAPDFAGGSGGSSASASSSSSMSMLRDDSLRTLSGGSSSCSCMSSSSYGSLSSRSAALSDKSESEDSEITSPRPLSAASFRKTRRENAENARARESASLAAPSSHPRRGGGGSATVRATAADAAAAAAAPLASPRVPRLPSLSRLRLSSGDVEALAATAAAVAGVSQGEGEKESDEEGDDTEAGCELAAQHSARLSAANAAAAASEMAESAPAAGGGGGTLVEDGAEAAFGSYAASASTPRARLGLELFAGGPSAGVGRPRGLGMSRSHDDGGWQERLFPSSSSSPGFLVGPKALPETSAPTLARRKDVPTRSKPLSFSSPSCTSSSPSNRNVEAAAAAARAAAAAQQMPQQGRSRRGRVAGPCHRKSQSLSSSSSGCTNPPDGAAPRVSFAAAFPAAAAADAAATASAAASAADGPGLDLSNLNLKRKRPPMLDIPTNSFTASPTGTPSSSSAFCCDSPEEEITEVAADGPCFAALSKRGRKRETLEDRFQAVCGLGGHEGQDYFGVFDGHGGTMAAEFASKQLHLCLLDALQKRTPAGDAVAEAEAEAEAAFVEAYEDTDRQFLAQACPSGTSCVTCLRTRDGLVIAHAGDCRAVLFVGGRVESLTEDHKASREDERRRMEELGGHVDCFTGVWRIQGIMAVSRGLGDQHLKEYITPTPETRTVRLPTQHEAARTPGAAAAGAGGGAGEIVATAAGTSGVGAGRQSDFLLLASDGLWDVLSNEEAASIVSGVLNPGAATTPLQREHQQASITPKCVRIRSRLSCFKSRLCERTRGGGATPKDRKPRSPAALASACCRGLGFHNSSSISRSSHSIFSRSKGAVCDGGSSHTNECEAEEEHDDELELSDSGSDSSDGGGKDAPRLSMPGQKASETAVGGLGGGCWPSHGGTVDSGGAAGSPGGSPMLSPAPEGRTEPMRERLKAACSRLVDVAVKQGSNDDITVMIVSLPNRAQQDI